jgi:hypothetical protein
MCDRRNKSLGERKYGVENIRAGVPRQRRKTPMSEGVTRRFVLTAAAARFAACPALATADEAAKIFHGVGTVTAVDAASGVLAVDHGDIPGFMDAMEMSYKARPRRWRTA